MTLIALTEIASGEARPIAVNPEHVASLRPRKTLHPVDAQQDPRSTVSYDGTILTLATGEQHFVIESFDTVHSMVTGTPDPPSPKAKKAQAVKKGNYGRSSEPDYPLPPEVTSTSEMARNVTHTPLPDLLDMAEDPSPQASGLEIEGMVDLPQDDK